MGELWSIIQGHLDQYGVREAAFARRMGTGPQTINAWKMRGLKRLPERHLLEAVARETGTPYPAVLKAALVDTGYLSASALSDDLLASSDPLPADAVQPEPHSTTVTAADIAAGVGLPLAAPRHRRTAPSSDTRRTPHR